MLIVGTSRHSGHARLKNEGSTEQSAEPARFGVRPSLSHSDPDLLASRLDVLGDRNQRVIFYFFFYDVNQFEFVYCNFFEELRVWLDVSATAFLQTRSSGI